MSKASRRRSRRAQRAKMVSPVHQAQQALQSAYEVRMLDASLLERDMAYQRPPDEEKIQKIVANFNPKVVNILKVSYRDGHYYVFDGSHTLEVLKRVCGEEGLLVECKVFHRLTQAQEAELFAIQTGESTRVSTVYRVRAEVVAGNEETIAFINATSECGFEINPERSKSKDGRILAVRKARSLYTTLGEDNYKKMLRILRSTWNGEAWSVSQNMLSGIGLLLQVYGDDLDSNRFVRKLSKLSEREMLREASLFTGLPVADKYATAMLKRYNNGGGRGCLAPAPLMQRRLMK